jgi:hypothetical protein
MSDTKIQEAASIPRSQQRVVRRLLPGIALKTERLETYDREEIAFCKCGEQINIVYGSDRTCNTDKTRLRYPDDTEGWCVFRCRKCGEVADPQKAKSPNVQSSAMPDV